MYFDYCATTPPDDRVIEAMTQCLRDSFGNPSSLHFYGRQAAAIVEDARQKVAALLGAKPDEIVFTSGATEANNLALGGILQPWEGKQPHLITCAIEHHAVLHTANQMKKMGCDLTVLPVDRQGCVDPDAVRQAIRPNTRLISIMHVNNEVGSIQPVAEIGKIARERGVTFHTDAVQGVGHLDTHVELMNVDLLSISAHKIYGPKGVGALFVRTGVHLEPQILGGPQERQLRAGTENTAGIAGFGVAADLVHQFRAQDCEKYQQLRGYFGSKVYEKISDVIINGAAPDHQSPHVLSLTFPGVVSEMLQIRLSMKNIAISLGSACNSSEIVPSHVLLAMGFSPELADATIRVSIGRLTTLAEIDQMIDILSYEINQMKR